MRAQQKWAYMTMVLGIEVVYARTLGMFYVEFLQAVFMYELDTCFMSPCIERTLGGSHHRVVRRLMRRQLRMVLGGRWVYPSMEEATVGVGLQEVDTYVSRRHNTVVHI